MALIMGWAGAGTQKKALTLTSLAARSIYLVEESAIFEFPGTSPLVNAERKQQNVSQPGNTHACE